MQIIDISNVPKNSKTYNGNTRKHGITVEGIDYIVKFPKDNDMSVFCEYVASNLIRSLDVPCHEVTLGIYKGILVNIIKDFTSGTEISLHSFKDTKQSSEDTEIGDKEYTYEDVIYLIDKHLKMTVADKMEAKKQFWKMFICDAIIGNRDRHWGNWGYIKLNKPNEGYKFAPLYDNGAGLYPGVNKVIEQYISGDTRKKFLYDRVYIVPASLFKIRRPDRLYRSNYAEMFNDLRINKLFAEQVALFKSRVSYEQVFECIYNICRDLPLNAEYRRFYIEIVTMRYMCIVLRMDFDKSYKIVEEALQNYA